ncbi:MAG: hypothetical protein Q4G52_08035 [Clostridia bacterium]|nr:hypothetical protein [Clostridia bacterium]
MLIAALLFYISDWASIMKADLTMKICSTQWWYNRRTNDITPNRFADLEEGDYLWRWIDALTHGSSVIIEDVEDIKYIPPVEYNFLKQNDVQTMIAVPFWKRSRVGRLVPFNLPPSSQG